MKTISSLDRSKMMMLGLTLALAASITAQAESPAGVVSPADAAAGRLFPAGLSSSQWQKFPASGYAKPVEGMVYRIDKDTVTRGEPMPLSGVWPHRRSPPPRSIRPPPAGNRSPENQAGCSGGSRRRT